MIKLIDQLALFHVNNRQSLGYADLEPYHKFKILFYRINKQPKLTFYLGVYNSQGVHPYSPAAIFVFDCMV